MSARKSDTVCPVSAKCLGVVFLLLTTLVVLSAAMLRYCRYDGLIRPFRIKGASMAPSLTGEHLSNTCQDCRFSIRYAADSLAAPEWLTCPNCGYRKTPDHLKKRQLGERVLVDRWAKYVSGIKRWEPVAFHRLTTSDTGGRWQQLVVKRVAGLPGEKISFSSGEIYADGVLQSKSLAQFRELAVLLFDTYYRPHKTRNMMDRFQPVNEQSRWQRLASGYRFDSSQQPRHWQSQDLPTDEETTAAPRLPIETDPGSPASTENVLSSADLDQLLYHHWACMANQVPWKARTAISPIEDHYPYNQGLSRGELFQVDDLLFHISLMMKDSGLLVISLLSGEDIFELWLQTRNKSYELRRNTDSIAKGKFLHALDKTPHELEFAVVDHQIIFAVNGRVWCQQFFSEQDSPPPAVASALDSGHPAMIAARDIKLQIQRIRLYRDIYWAGPSHTSENWQFKRRLRPAEFFLVGDNVPVSEDSRHWGEGILRKAILGKVLRYEPYRPVSGR